MEYYLDHINSNIHSLEEIEGWYEIDKKNFLDNCEDEEFEDFDDYLRGNFTYIEPENLFFDSEGEVYAQDNDPSNRKHYRDEKFHYTDGVSIKNEVILQFPLDDSEIGYDTKNFTVIKSWKNGCKLDIFEIIKEKLEFSVK